MRIAIATWLLHSLSHVHAVRPSIEADDQVLQVENATSGDLKGQPFFFFARGRLDDQSKEIMKIGIRQMEMRHAAFMHEPEWKAAWEGIEEVWMPPTRSAMAAAIRILGSIANEHHPPYMAVLPTVMVVPEMRLFDPPELEDPRTFTVESPIEDARAARAPIIIGVASSKKKPKRTKQTSAKVPTVEGVKEYLYEHAEQYGVQIRLEEKMEKEALKPILESFKDQLGQDDGMIVTDALKIYEKIHKIKQKLARTNKKVLMIGEPRLGDYMFMAGLPQIRKKPEVANYNAKVMARSFVWTLNEAAVVKGRWEEKLHEDQNEDMAENPENRAVTYPYFSRIDVPEGMEPGDWAPGEVKLGENCPNVLESGCLPFDKYEFVKLEARNKLPANVQWESFLLMKRKRKLWGAKYTEPKPRIVSIVANTGQQKGWITWNDPLGDEPKAAINLEELVLTPIDTHSLQVDWRSSQWILSGTADFTVLHFKDRVEEMIASLHPAPLIDID